MNFKVTLLSESIIYTCLTYFNISIYSFNAFLPKYMIFLFSSSLSDIYNLVRKYCTCWFHIKLWILWINLFLSKILSIFASPQKLISKWIYWILLQSAFPCLYRNVWLWTQSLICISIFYSYCKQLFANLIGISKSLLYEKSSAR